MCTRHPVPVSRSVCVSGKDAAQARERTRRPASGSQLPDRPCACLASSAQGADPPIDYTINICPSADVPHYDSVVDTYSEVWHGIRFCRAKDRISVTSCSKRYKRQELAISPRFFLENRTSPATYRNPGETTRAHWCGVYESLYDDPVPSCSVARAWALSRRPRGIRVAAQSVLFGRRDCSIGA